MIPPTPPQWRRRTATLLALTGLWTAAGCGDANQVARELARVKASASATAMDAERARLAAEAEESAQAAADQARPSATAPRQVAPTQPTDAADAGDAADPAGSSGRPATVETSATAGLSAATRTDATSVDAMTSLATLDARYGPIGVAVVPVGGGNATSYGSVTGGVAWSTIKVPLAVAAVRADGGRPTAATSALIRRAITVSDNAAAERLWARLGRPAAASAAVGAVLADGGDAQTRVPTRRLRSGFTVFGQTNWPLARAASYAAQLPCQRGAAPVLTQMGQISAGQRWGLGVLGRAARFKGGWGPDPGGAYLVRQLGVLTLPGGGQVGVAIASRPSSGSFADGTAALTAVSRWLSSRAGSLPSGRC